ncbi:MAG: hypothetical protein ABMA64_05500 [Myxococcota bacterium]
MAAERQPMRKTKEILRLKLELHRSHREVGRAVGVSPGAVASVVTRAAIAGLDVAAIDSLSEEEIEEKLYPKVPPEVAGKRDRALPDFAQVHAERLKPGVTLELLHMEYREGTPEGYGYTQFCEHYRRWVKQHGLVMRQEHRAGDKLFVDYSGKKPQIVDQETGEGVEVELFVAVLGASNYTYAEVTATQRVPDFVASHVRTFEFLGGVTACLVPDHRPGTRAGIRIPFGVPGTASWGSGSPFRGSGTAFGCGRWCCPRGRHDAASAGWGARRLAVRPDDTSGSRSIDSARLSATTRGAATRTGDWRAKNRSGSWP